MSRYLIWNTDHAQQNFTNLGLTDQSNITHYSQLLLKSKVQHTVLACLFHSIMSTQLLQVSLELNRINWIQNSLAHIKLRASSCTNSLTLLGQRHCIVSIHLYSASCSAHQSEALPVRETQKEERVLRERKEALGSPVNKVDRVEGRSWFQSEGPMIAKARVLAIEVLAHGTKRYWLSKECRIRFKLACLAYKILTRSTLPPPTNNLSSHPFLQSVTIRMGLRQSHKAQLLWVLVHSMLLSQGLASLKPG